MSERTDVVLAIDEGTSGTRAATVNAAGHASCLNYRPLRVSAPRPGVVEQDAAEILEKTLAACRGTLKQAAAKGQRVVALALATQRATAILWDRQTGAPLVPAMVWQDTRYAAELGIIGRLWDTSNLIKLGRPVGVRSPYYWAARHLRETETVMQARRNGRLCFGTVDTWLLWHLSGRTVHATTPTNASSAGAYMLVEHRYLLEWLAALEFPPDLLPELRQDADAFGRTDPALLGIDVPIRASMGDQHAGAIGIGCLQRGQALCIHGTGSFVDVIIGPEQPIKTSLHAATTVMTARRFAGTSHFAVESFVATTGSALNWLCEKLEWFADAAEISRLAIEAGSSGGTTFLPALTGLRFPALQPRARAALSGISIATTRSQIAHAVLEGIAHSVVTCLEANQTVAGVEAESLIVGGGLSSSDALLQLQADLTGIPIRRKPDTDRASLRGTALLAGSNGLLWDGMPEHLFADEDDQVFTPQIDAAARHERRADWHARVDAELKHADAFGNG